ncbi:hypothetical protein ACFVW1_02570 [Streptomyces olivochromogenes]|uniref:hypothetical protein n=1 Tax=Streptomyces olivochromogenes TaxID=1963 RepID=UPI0036DD0F75
MPRSSALLCVTALVLAIGVGCSSPAPDPKIPAVSAPSPSRSPEPSPASPAAEVPTAAAPGKVPKDLRDLDWAHTAVPGDFCDVPGLITFTSGEALAQSRTYGKVHTEHRPAEVVYGNVLGDSRVEAALLVGCDNNGGTGSGRIVWAYLVFASEQDKLKVIGVLTPQQAPPSSGASEFEKVQLTAGRVTAFEKWHRDTDPSCCPSGRAVTTWTPRAGGTLEAGAPRITA